GLMMGHTEVLAGLSWLFGHGLGAVTSLPFFAALVIHDLRTSHRVQAVTMAGGIFVYTLSAIGSQILIRTHSFKTSTARATAANVRTEGRWIRKVLAADALEVWKCSDVQPWTTARDPICDNPAAFSAE